MLARRLIGRAPTAAPPPPDYLTGLVLRLKFDETSGDTAFDSSGEGNDCNFASTPAWVSGPYGRAADFNGTTNRGTISNPSAALQVISPRTIMVWIKPDTYGTNPGSGDRFGRILRTANGTTDFYTINRASDREGFSVKQFNTLRTAEYSVVLNEWQLIGYSNNIAIDWQFRRNNADFDSPYGGVSYQFGNQNTYIGNFDGGTGTPRFYDGLMAELRIYDHRLTLSQWQQVFDATKAGRGV